MSKEMVLTEQEKIMCSLSFTAYWGICRTTPLDVMNEIKPHLDSLSQELVWGPAVHSPKNLFNIRRNEKLNDAMMYITQTKGKNEYNIVIRGTNPFSINSWITQDLTVYEPLYSWDSVVFGNISGKDAEQPDSNGAISRGAKKTVSLCTDLIPDSTVAGTDTFYGFLRDKIDSDTIINFTGHSLGGLAAPTLALWCIDKFDNWFDIKDNIFVYPFAGPTAGDQIFAAHSDDIFNDSDSKRCVRYQNNLDVVPKAFSYEDLESTKTIYNPYQNTPDMVIDMIDDIQENVNNIYHQLAYSKAIPSRFIKSLDFDCTDFWNFISFFLQVIYQHVVPYLKSSLFKKEEMSELIEMMINNSNFEEKDKNIMKEKFLSLISEE
jgi:hypothetical protein